MKYFPLISLFIILSTHLIAQTDLRSGYIIKSNNDTIYGQIKYRGSHNSSKKCIFLKDSLSTEQIFTPDDILGYRYENNKYYVSKSVSSNNKTEQLFLEFLINGIVDIYYYRDEMEDHYFIEEGDSNLIELKNKISIIKIDNDTYQKEGKEYVGILRYVFQDQPNIQKKVDQTSLSHKSLINIAKDYHLQVCADQDCIVYEKNTSKNTRKFGIVIDINAIGITSLKKTDPIYYLDDVESSINFSPGIGLFYMSNFQYINEKVFFIYEITYNPVLIDFSNSYTERAYNMTYNNDVDLKMHTLNNVASIRFVSLKRKMKPYIETGGYYYYSIASGFKRDLEAIYSWGDTYYKEEFYNNPFQKYDFGALIGFGASTKFLQSKEIYFGFRYMRGFGLAKGINSNTLSINIGVQLF